jgi:hypothetical protein
MTKKTEPESKFEMGVNGHTLKGEKRKGKWRWVCPDWPDLADYYKDDISTDPIVAEFMRRALAGAVKITMLARGE